MPLASSTSTSRSSLVEREVRGVAVLVGRGDAVAVAVVLVRTVWRTGCPVTGSMTVGPHFLHQAVVAVEAVLGRVAVASVVAMTLPTASRM